MRETFWKEACVTFDDYSTRLRSNPKKDLRIHGTPAGLDRNGCYSCILWLTNEPNSCFVATLTTCGMGWSGYLKARNIWQP